jgi:asparagine synthase (glutamine-hydrolysing)
MCGIFGMVGRYDHQGLREAALTLKHRGPDGFGEWASPGNMAYLAHCRLAIIDLSEAGRQPMANEDGGIQLTFNGEIYNFAELREELIAAGHRFASHADSEVIIHGYEQWGEDVVGRLRGIFAFALWDQPRKRLFLARDHLGVKPLYYMVRGGEFAFASEPRALLPLLQQPLTPDVDALFSFLRLGYVQGSRSIWEGISRLPAATTLSFDGESGTVALRRYWTPPVKEVPRTLDEAVAATGELLESAVREQLVSDVPIGVFLSGGIDSSLIAAVAAKAKPDIDSFFVDFIGWEGSERDDARTAAAHVGTRHHVGEINQAAFDLHDPKRAHQFFAAFDEPIADLSILPTWHLARRIREQVTVALSGDGGDELFGGYSWYRQVEATPRRRLAWFVERMRRKVGLGREWPSGCADQHEYYHLLHFTSFTTSELAMLFPQWAEKANKLRAGIRTGRKTEASTDDPRYWQQLDLQTFLVDSNLARVDRASMAHGLEVRVPLLDYRIAELALSLPPALVDPGMGGKPVLRRLAAQFLPTRLQTKPKQGFSFPLERVISTDAMISTLRDGSMARRGMLDKEGLEAWLHQGNQELKLWLLFVLEHWARQWLYDEVTQS